MSDERVAAPDKRSWGTLTLVHARWTFANTWRNGEQLLLLIGLPLAALLALTRTDLIASSTSPLVITSAMVVLGAGFTSPAISIAFERRYGSFAFLGTTPLPRTALISGTLLATALTTLAALVIVASLASALGGVDSANLGNVAVAVMFGLIAFIPWAFVVGGAVRSETVLVLANGIFVVAILFGGVLIPASSLPYGSLLPWLPTGALMDAAVAPSPLNAGVLLAWGVVGTALTVKLFRWR